MGDTGGVKERAPGESPGSLRLLQLAAFFSIFDRFAVAPMLVSIAAALEATLAETTATASLYYLFYGLMQPVWGMLSDRFGRVRVIRLMLFGAAFAGVLSALAPNLAVLIVARALAGGLFAAVIPASLVYVGDTVGLDSRQKALADLMAASAVGTALATVLGVSPPTSTPGASPSRLRLSPASRSLSCSPDYRSRKASPQRIRKGRWSRSAGFSVGHGPWW